MSVLPALPVRLSKPSLFCWILLSCVVGTRSQVLDSTPPEQNIETQPPEMRVEKSDAAPKATRLKLKTPVERELKGGSTNTYEIKLKKGQFLHVVAEQKGIDVVLTLIDPSGKELVAADTGNGMWGPEPASVIAEMSGVYQAQVKSLDKNAAAGKYTVTVEELRDPKPGDETRIAAERTMFAAGLAQVQQQSDSLQNAIGLYQKAAKLWHTVPEPYEEALCLTEIATIDADLGKNQEALEVDNQALPLYRAARDRIGEATILNNIGLIYWGLGDMQKALEYFYEILPVVHSAGHAVDEAKVLSNIGVVLNNLGENQKALENLSQALPLHRVAGDRVGEATTLGNLCTVYAILGKEQQALENCDLALSVLHAMGNLRGEATALNNIGLVYARFGELQKALEHYKQALSISRAAGDHFLEAVLLNNIGGVYGDLGETKKELEYYGQSLPLARSIGDRNGEAMDLSNIGSAYWDLGDKQKALDFYNQSLPLRRAVGDRDGEALTLNNIGLAYFDLGEKQKALDYYGQALELNRAVGDRRDEALVLDNMAAVYAALGEKQKAVDNFSDALVLYRAVQDPQGEGTTLKHLMHYWKKEQESPGVAIFFGKQAVNAFQQIRRNIQGLDAGLQKSFLESKANVYRELGDLLITQGRLAEAQQVLDLLKEEEYFEFVRGGGNAMEARSQPVTLNPEEQASHEAYEKIAGQITTMGAEFSELRAKRTRTAEEEARFGELKDKLTLANQEMGRFFKTLYVEFGKNMKANQSAESVREETSGMQTLVRELGPGTVALYTLVGETHYSVIVITASTMQAREYPIAATDLRKKVAAFLEALKNPASDPLPAAQELYKILVEPIATDLKGGRAQTLMWSLNDVLRYVPMAALHDGKQYLVENYRNVVITPASIGRLKDKVDVSDSSIAGMGVSKDYDGLGALPAVPEELKHIIRDEKVAGAAGVQAGTVLLDDDFTEARMASALDKHYPVVHIASHFVLQVGNETNSYLLLGGKDVGGKGYHLTLAELRDDPALTFDGTELLTLSACQTGASGTALNGREVDGLGITAQQKGAKAVLASLWSVADESTALLMADFYKHWLGTPGTTKAGALQQAQLDMLRGAAANKATADRGIGVKKVNDRDHASSFSHPFYWAPFILIGNWK